MIVQDKCLIQIARNNSMRTLHNSNQEASDGITSSLHSASKMAQNIRQNNCYITKLNIHGAEFVRISFIMYRSIANILNR